MIAPAGKMVCPDHRTRLVRVQTRYGGRWRCTVDGCTVRCWEGRTATPCNAKTAAARNAMHKMFDPIWQDEAGLFSKGKRKNTRHVRRHRAYLWLSQRMGLSFERTHFGMFTLEQCDEAREHVQTLLNAQKILPPPATEAEARKRHVWDLHDLAVWVDGPEPAAVECVIQ